MTDRTWWGDGPLPEPMRISPLGHLRGAVKALALLVVNFGCLILLLLLRLVEAPLCRPHQYARSSLLFYIGVTDP